MGVLLLAADGGEGGGGGDDRGDDTTTRQRVYALVQQHPGLHQRDLARRLALRASHVEYHLHRLERAGLVRSERQRGYRRYFVTLRPGEPIPEGAVRPEDRSKLALLREARPLEIVARLLQDEPMQLGELAAQVGIAQSTLTYHVKKLEDHGIVERFRDGNVRLVRLTEREHLTGLLLAHEPPDDLVAGFEELWDDIGV